jgi:hypothetical protein
LIRKSQSFVALGTKGFSQIVMAPTRTTHRENYSQQFSHPKKILHRLDNLLLQTQTTKDLQGYNATKVTFALLVTLFRKW